MYKVYAETFHKDVHLKAGSSFSPFLFQDVIVESMMSV